MIQLENISDFLRKETEQLDKNIKKIENKMMGILSKQGVNGISKLTELNYKKEILQQQQFKLYEMIGRLDEIEQY